MRNTQERASLQHNCPLSTVAGELRDTLSKKITMTTPAKQWSLAHDKKG